MIRSTAVRFFPLVAMVTVAAAALPNAALPAAVRADDPADPVRADPVRMVLDLLAADDADLRCIGLDGVRHAVKGSEATYRIAAVLSKLPPASQAALIAAFADRGDAAAIPAITATLLAARDPAVRTAAIRALGTLGSGMEVALLKKCLAGDEPDRTTARRALVVVRGRDTAKQLAEAAKYGDPALRPTFVEILAERRERAVAPELLVLAAGDDGATRVAAVRALTALGGTAELGGLVDVLLKAAAGERGELEKAVVAICTTNRGHAESAAAFSERFKAAAEPEREILLPTLSRIGGSAAPAVVE
jgi:HEAT repeat protein